MACRDSGGTKCAGTQTAPTAGVMAPSESFFKPIVAGNQKAFSAVFLHSSALSGTYRAPLPGVLLCRSAREALKGALWVGSYSVIQRVRHLMGQPLYYSTAEAGVWGERGYGYGSTLYG